MSLSRPSPPPGRDVAAIAISYLRARVALRGARRGARVRCHGRLLVPRAAGVDIGPRSIFFGGTIPTELRCGVGAELVIGPRSLVNYGVSIDARQSVRIGSECLIASLVHIRDDDGRRSAPVTIGDRVWIAYGAVIEPGSSIGDGAVIGAMAVVSGAVPAGSLATGNPAQYVPLAASDPELAALGSRPASRVAHSLEFAPEGDAELPRPDGGRRHAPDAVRAAIVEWLDDTRHFGAAASLIRDESMSLRTGGVLDSLGVVELVVMLEKRFGVMIDRRRVARADAQSMNAFVELVTLQVKPRP